MNTTAHVRTPQRQLIAAGLVASLLTGCSTMTGRPTSPLQTKRDEPGVVLCMSERIGGGGLRLIGKLEKGIYPITRATLQYRSVGPSDPVPAGNGEDGLELTNARSEKVAYRKGADEVTFAIDADSARGLRGKVLWYRWIIEYDRNGSPRRDVTAIHRTSLEEAGLPRAAGTPGPDSSVGLPTTRRH